MSVAVRVTDADPHAAALREYAKEHDRLFAEQERIEQRADELYQVNSNDISDMVADLVEEYPERAIEMLTLYLSPIETPCEEDAQRQWFYNTWIAGRC
ncbi:MAG: hypothetical protein IE928_10285, partial [Gammaproteobacteria bacterium]|nr:hypothetical protein [Gammaproteobacteria bacterium]